jgi:glucuronate isomerase
MSRFIHNDFLLRTGVARQLYHDVAKPLPVVDYHNHLDARSLADDVAYEDLTALWIAGDPYKHRAMRIAGVPEAYITGPASPREKFDRWAATVPATIGNPLHHWSALELDRFFGIDVPLSPATADAVWERTHAMLRQPTHTARGLLARMNVACVCTSDRPGDDLSHHVALAATDGRTRFRTRVSPSLRIDGPDAEVSDTTLDAFHRAGCRLADHSLDRVAYDASSESAARFRALARQYRVRGWALQLHMGAQRQTSSRLRDRVGPAGGYATAGAPTDVAALCGLLDDLERRDALPRVILYPLNPADYAPLAILTGSFAEDGVRGKIQLGPAWWFNDHASGIASHLDALSSYGLLSTFVGMTTDSRSLLSMVRHEYFRRVLCDWIGHRVEAGFLPDDRALLDELVRGICFENAVELLGLRGGIDVA